MMSMNVIMLTLPELKRKSKEGIYLILARSKGSSFTREVGWKLVAEGLEYSLSAVEVSLGNLRVLLNKFVLSYW